jgi:predicted nuclease of predicted toxin-antitoxin system
VKLLLDANLAPRLAAALSDLFPESKHVRNVGLERADDRSIWDFARDNGFTILSKDSDFHQLSFVLGAPPKVIWIRAGNRSTQELERIVRSRTHDIGAFAADPDETFLVVEVT